MPTYCRTTIHTLVHNYYKDKNLKHFKNFTTNRGFCLKLELSIYVTKEKYYLVKQSPLQKKILFRSSGLNILNINFRKQMGKSQGQFDMIEVSHCLVKAELWIRMFLGSWIQIRIH
jgi:hypothetical protein